MKVALVHDWLTGMRGGERCLEAFLCLYPDADIHTLVHVPGTTSPQIDARVRGTSFLSALPGIQRWYRSSLPLFPLAARSLDLSDYDVVISLSHAAAKNVRVRPGTPHICYCFTPMRYIWDQASSYFKGAAFVAAQPIIHFLRRWDRRGAERVTEFVAISSFVAARIRAYYGRRAFVIPPPVRMPSEVDTRLTDAERRVFDENPEPFFLCAGALVPYKRIDVAVEAFSRLGLRLWVTGAGSELESLRLKAQGSVRFFGQVSDGFLWECYRRCRALVFPGIEDFGITPVECLASGRPVIGVQAGGLAETVQGPVITDGLEAMHAKASGIFIPKHLVGAPEALQRAVEFFCRHEDQFDPVVMKERAREFGYGRFFVSWRSLAEQLNIYPGLPEPQKYQSLEGTEAAKLAHGVC